MDLEVLIGIIAVFVAGGGVGAAGTLMTQWVLRKIDGPSHPPPHKTVDRAEVDLLRSEVAEMNRHLYNLDTRLDFAEQLLGGAIPTTMATGRLASQGSEPRPRPGEAPAEPTTSDAEGEEGPEPPV